MQATEKINDETKWEYLEWFFLFELGVLRR